MPSDTFSHTVRIAASPDAIYAALQEPDTWKGIGPIESVWDDTRDSDGRLDGFSWSARAAGRSWKGTAERTATRPDESMTLELDSPEVGGAVEVTLDPDGETTTVTVTIDAHSKGMLSGMFWSVIADALRSGMASQVERFGGRF